MTIDPTHDAGASDVLCLDRGTHGDEGHFVTIHGHVIFIPDDHGTGANGKGGAFTKHGLEHKLVKHHESRGGSDWHDHRAAEAEGSGGDLQGPSRFTFHRQLPGEVKRHIEDNPAARRLFRTTDNAADAKGADALASMGDRYWNMVDDAAGGHITKAIETAEKSDDPEARFHAAIYKELPKDRTKQKQGVIAGDKLRDGQSFTINGRKFEVREGDDGLMLHGGGDFPETPVAALSEIPIDKYSLKGRKTARFKGDEIAPFSAAGEADIALSQGHLYGKPVGGTQGRLYDRPTTKDRDGHDGHWVTIHGARVFIKRGESVGKALREHFAGRHPVDHSHVTDAARQVEARGGKPHVAEHDKPSFTAQRVDPNKQLGMFAKDKDGNPVEVGERAGQASLFHDTAKAAPVVDKAAAKRAEDAKATAEMFPAVASAKPAQLYHVTFPEHVDAIKSGGFKGSTSGEMGPGLYLTDKPGSITGPKYAGKQLSPLAVDTSSVKFLTVPDDMNLPRAFLHTLYGKDAGEKKLQELGGMRADSKILGDGGRWNWPLFQEMAKAAGYGGIEIGGSGMTKNRVVFDPSKVRVKDVASAPVYLSAPADLQPAVTLGQGYPSEFNGQPIAYQWVDSAVSGNWTHPRTGQRVPIDAGRIRGWVKNVKAALSRGVDIPAVKDHKETADASLGAIFDAREVDGRLQLLAGFYGDDALNVARRNKVSVGIDPNFKDSHGNHYGESIRHLAFTPVPVIHDLKGFIAASRGEPTEADYLTLAPEKEVDMLDPELMPRIAQHLGDGATDDADAIVRQLLDRADRAVELSNLLDARDQTITELSASQPAAPAVVDPEALRDRADLYESRIDLMLSRGDLPKFVADKLKARVRANGKPNLVLLSTAADTDTRPIDDILGLFDGAKLGLRGRGEATPAQQIDLSRSVPDAPASGTLEAIGQQQADAMVKAKLAERGIVA